MVVVSGDRAVAGRAVVAYLVELRPIMQRSVEMRRPWIQQLGLLMGEARAGDPLTISRRAGRLGHEQMQHFREAERQVAALVPPPDCVPCHEAIVGWLDRHVAACEALVRIESSRSVNGFRAVQERLAEGRDFAQRFNVAYAALVADLQATFRRPRRGRMRSAVWDTWRRVLPERWRSRARA